MEGALRTSNAQFEPTFVLDRIGIRLAEAQPGSLSRHQPLDALALTAACVCRRHWMGYFLTGLCCRLSVECYIPCSKHHKIPRDLSNALEIKTRRMGFIRFAAIVQFFLFHGLVESWEQLMEFKRRHGLSFLPKLLPVMHKCTLYRSQMAHVIQNLSAFIMFEVRTIADLLYAREAAIFCVAIGVGDLVAAVARWNSE